MVFGEVVVMLHDEGQPNEIVGEPGSHAPATVRMPPVLYVAFLELAPRAAHDVLTCYLRLRVRKGHDVLKLIPESECSAGLVYSRSRPHPARQRLVKRPLVENEIECRLGCPDRDHPETGAPHPRGMIDCRVRRIGARISIVEIQCGLLFRRGAQEIYDLPRLARQDLDLRLQRSALIDGVADVATQRRSPQCGGVRQLSISSDEFAPRSGERGNGFACG